MQYAITCHTIPKKKNVEKDYSITQNPHSYGIFRIIEAKKSLGKIKQELRENPEPALLWGNHNLKKETDAQDEAQ